MPPGSSLSGHCPALEAGGVLTTNGLNRPEREGKWARAGEPAALTGAFSCMDVPTYILNHKAVVEFFGRWPSFHDAEVPAYEAPRPGTPELLTYAM